MTTVFDFDLYSFSIHTFVTHPPFFLFPISFPASSLTSSPLPSLPYSVVVDEVLGLVLTQYLTAQSLMKNIQTLGGQGPGESSLKTTFHSDLSPLPTCHMTLSELLSLLADLVSTVPGVATCVHKFHTLPAPPAHPTSTTARTNSTNHCFSSLPASSSSSSSNHPTSNLSTTVPPTPAQWVSHAQLSPSKPTTGDYIHPLD